MRVDLHTTPLATLHHHTLLAPNHPKRGGVNQASWGGSFGRPSVASLNALIVLELVVRMVDLMAPDVVEVDSRELSRREHERDRHAPERLPAQADGELDPLPKGTEHRCRGVRACSTHGSGWKLEL